MFFKVNEGLMRNIVSEPFEDNYFKVENYRDLAKNIYDILRKPCPILNSTPRPTDPANREYFCVCINLLFIGFAVFNCIICMQKNGRPS